MEKVARATIYLLIDCGFEGRYTINVRDVRLIEKDGSLKLHIDGVNGELTVEVEKTNRQVIEVSA